MRILLSRTDNLGDVMLTLPMAGVIKTQFPESKILFLGKPYTKALIDNCEHIDEFHNWTDIQAKGLGGLRADAIVHVLPQKEIAIAAKKANIKLRIGTSHRLFHLLTCNKLINLGRKNSDLHESQLNIKLLKPLGVNTNVSHNEIKELYGWKKSVLQSELTQFIYPDKFNLIFHTKSKGSALDYALEKFYTLANNLDADRFQILLTGTASEGELIKNECPDFFNLPHVTDLTGKLDLSQLINLIQHCQGLVACSTGPLHIAAASGIHCLGLYSSKRPMHASRWGPVGKKSIFLEDDGKSVKHLNISAERVLHCINKWKEK